MKTYKFLTAVALLSLSFNSFAQKGVEDGSKYGHGEDSVTCIMNLVQYGDQVKLKNYKEAYEPWKIVFEQCPLAKISLYSDGEKIMKHMIQTDKANKDTYYDMLLRVYDQRMKYFGKNKKYPTSYLKGKRALDMMQYKGTDKNVRKEAVALFAESLNGDPATIQPAFLQNYMLHIVGQFKDDEISNEDVINAYTKCSAVGAKVEAVAAPNMKELATQAREQVEQIFAQSGAADCSILTKIYQPQLADNATNAEWLKKINKLLANSDCTESDLFYAISENLHKISPEASSARGLARMYVKQNDMEKALSYYDEAIRLEEDDKLKAKYFYEVGLINYAAQNYVAAKTAAYKASNLRSDWGDPYLLLAKVYAQGARSIGEKDYEKRAGYWAAVDKAMRAKAVDSSENVQKEANELIRQYSQHFPSKEDLFFEGLKDGSSYKVGGFINEQTTVRAKK